MSKPIFFTDIDGTLLNLYGVVSEIMHRKYRKFHEHLVVGPPIHYGMEEAYGVNEQEVKDMFGDSSKVWKYPAFPYAGAVKFVQDLKNNGFRVLGLTLRPTFNSEDAVKRDVGVLNLDGLYVVKRSMDKVSVITKLSEGKRCFYLDDHITTAILISERCFNAQVMLIDRPWNKSLDLCMAYSRVFSYNAIVDGAKFFNERIQRA